MDIKGSTFSNLTFYPKLHRIDIDQSSDDSQKRLFFLKLNSVATHLRFQEYERLHMACSRAWKGLTPLSDGVSGRNLSYL